MTTSASTGTTAAKAPDNKATVDPGLVASVQLRAASSQTQFRILAAIYLALMAYGWWPGAVIAGFLLPLFCDPTHPRRALWLWTAGLLAGMMSLMTSRSILYGLGGLTGSFGKDPVFASLGLGLGVLGVAIMLWHLSWVKSPRRMP